jgi:hypothetical protein
MVLTINSDCLPDSIIRRAFVVDTEALFFIYELTTFNVIYWKFVLLSVKTSNIITHIVTLRLNYVLIYPYIAGVHPTSYEMGTGGSFPGVKRQRREADHSPPSSAEVKKMWIYTSTPPYVFTT